jgi:hypothetical protein
MGAAWCMPKTAGPLGGAKRAGLMVSVSLLAALSTSPEVSAQCAAATYNFTNEGGNRNLVPPGSPLIPVINSVNTAFLTNTTSFVSSPLATQPDQNTGGVWARNVGGSIDTFSKTTTTARPFDVGELNGPFPTPHVFASGSQKCLQVTHQEYMGYQVGIDLGKINIGGSGGNWHFGITAGSLNLRTEDRTPASTFTSHSFQFEGDLKSQFEVPFIGVYTTYTMGNFFIDAAVRWDFYQGALSSVRYDYSGVKDNARAVSLTSSAGYRMALASNWFLEPSVSMSLSRVQVDPVLLIDSQGIAGHNLQVNDITSILGRGGLRIGTNITQGSVVLQPFATASVIHEFESDAISTATLVRKQSNVYVQLPGPPATTIVSGIAGLELETHTERVGTYGQFGLGLTVVAGDTGWLGYGRVDGRVGENITGFSYNAGLRYQW